MTFFNRNRFCEYIIERDWLSFSVRARENIDTLVLQVPSFLIQEECDGTNRFGCRTIFWDRNGYKVFTLLYRPKSKILDSQIVFVEVGNRYLYGRLEMAIDALRCLFQWDFNNVSRYDICLDFPLKGKYQEVIERLYRHKYYLQRYANGSQFIKEFTANQMSWGMPQSSVKWKLYNKSLELKVGTQKAEKPYIVSQWIEAGMDVFHVWRLEVSLTGLSMVVFDKTRLTLERVLSDEYMIEVLSSLYHDRFVIKKDEGKNRKSNNKTVEFLKMPECDYVQVAMKPNADGKPTIAGLEELNALMRTMSESKFVRASVPLMRHYVELARKLLTPQLIQHYNHTHEVNLYDQLEQYLFDAEGIRAAW